MIMWSYVNPVFLDFESQSACDIKESGGRYYAEHESTRILILSCYFDNNYYIWIPDYIRTNVSNSNLWPKRLKPEHSVHLYRGNTCPEVILNKCATTPVVAHNAFMFDKHIWDCLIRSKVLCWLDSMYLARCSGKPGGLDKLGEQLIGEGKDHAKKLLPKLTTAINGPFGYQYPRILPGDLEAFTRYAVADVEILRRIWNTFDDVNVETDVIDVHNKINERGIEVDSTLLDQIQRISRYSVAESIEQITRLTKGQLHEGNIRSTKQVHEWLDRWGVKVTDDNGKLCLRKEIVQRYIDSPYLIESNITAVTEIPPLVIDVLQLRMKALRITDAKLKKASQRLSKDNRARDLITYHVAHTGRKSSQGIQIHNLPRPDSRVDIESILELLAANKDERNDRSLYEKVKQIVPETSPNEKLLTVDDICSALIRPMFKAKKGYTFAISDYEQVEARGIAWIAGERKSLDSFLKGMDPYKEFGATVFNCTYEQVTPTQRQVAKNAVLGLGYGMGPEKFRIYAANNGCNLIEAGVTAEFVVNKYRDTYTRICGWKPDSTSNFRVGGVWKDLDKATKECVSKGLPTFAGKCGFRMKQNDLICTLPSGREMWYPEAKIEDVIPPYVYVYNLPPVPKATIVYTSPRGRKPIFGGLIAENIVQALCRDLMCCAMVQMDREEMDIVLDVHDEIIVETSKPDSTLVRMVEIMSDIPDWAHGFPLSCKGYLSPRFVKEAFKGAYQYSTKDLRKAA